ncbi:lipoprotein-releasing ABC transporter permease subunit [Lutibaculum baratangense]|uniref:Lipoprotein releasing system transmembrane protein LolE n=1 Tax=Lutibaculum baratangense AMV1 TaxID=631454 RepID=V4RG58_9HYPH|nr:lipoprotein-releasing ABC transporter permease subunit [Lutibaculum baratangense]ESR25131.1 Lipoprotein releasing system transmembrane protein LolE [Lutibaculum baratangense AMV1]
MSAPSTYDTKPFARFEWMLSLRYLRARRKESFISVIAGFSLLGITLGVATLIIVMAVMNGFRTELLSKILGLNGHFIVQGIDTDFTDFDDVVGQIRGIEGVNQAFPYVEGQALASSPVNNFGVLVRGIRRADLENFQSIAGNVKLGSLDNFGDGEGVVIGIRLAEQLGLRVGDKLTLISPRGAVTPFGTTPRIKAYDVYGIFEIGMSEYDGAFVFMPFGEAQAYFNQDGLATGVEVFVDDADAIRAYRARMQDAVERPIYVLDWTQRNQTFFSALEVERNVMFLILTLIVLVAAMNIISGLHMLVKDKSRDIAILRTMGATRRAIMRIFFITGASIGVAGTFLGLIVGVVVCLNIEGIRQVLSRITGTELFSPELYYLSRLPAEMNFGDVFSVVLMALVLSFLATLYPAWRAARLDPVEALRYE